MKCIECNDPINARRLKIVPKTLLCKECQEDQDVFKFKMKTVGFNDFPTIARDLESWNLLRKQRQTKDI